MNADRITIVIRKIRPGIWGFHCPPCEFTFERTSVEHARAWAATHVLNTPDHDDIEITEEL